MADKVATALIYMDMVAAADLCKVVTKGVAQDYKIYVFDGKEYLSFNMESMSFEDACKYLSAVYAAVYTINQRPITESIFSNHAVKVVMQYANRVFRKGYNLAYKETKAAYEKAMAANDVVAEKKYEKKIEEILRLMSRNDILQLARDPALADMRCEVAKNSLDSAIKNLAIATATPSEFEELKEGYAREIQTNGTII